jgi:hypothetical protein
MQRRIHWLLAAIFSFIIQACGSDPVLEDCSNGLDDDLNGSIDCNDISCQNVAICNPVEQEVCNNGLDDDNNSLTDCEDIACAAEPTCQVDPCGNNTIDTGEQCDGNNLNGSLCSDFGFDGGVLSCKQDCTLDTLGCTNELCNNNIDDDLDGLTDCNDADCATAVNCQTCGNNVINAGEECDANNLNGASCSSLGFDGGVLFCNNDCTLNQSNCADEVCFGGLDDDGDGLVDCADSNCANAANCVPTCGDGLINQGNEQCDGNNLNNQAALAWALMRAP